MHPLLEGDGSCALIYDLERAAVLEVPEELRLHVAPALEVGDLDDELLSWLVNEDLLSTESWVGWAGEEDNGSRETTSGWSYWAVHRFDDEVHARVSPLSESEVTEVLEPVFKQGVGASRVQLLLDWDGTFPAVPLVERLIGEARRMAAPGHQEASFELVLDSRNVTHAAAESLLVSPLHVRLRCGAFPAPGAAPVEQRAWTAGTAPWLLLQGMADRLNVQCSLASGARLTDLWSWAKRSGIRQLDAVHADLSAQDGIPPLILQVSEYLHDLLAVCEEMASDLEAGRIPIDFRPLTRMVRRLMGSETHIEPVSEPEPGWEADSPAWPDMWTGGDRSGQLYKEDQSPAIDPSLSPCRACWARSLCNHSTLLAPSVADDRREPSPERCPLWLAEAEAALRLYHRLAQCDPVDVLRLLGDAARMPLDPLGRREEPAIPKQPFCVSGGGSISWSRRRVSCRGQQFRLAADPFRSRQRISTCGESF
jgi:hypothetical protein